MKPPLVLLLLLLSTVAAAPARAISAADDAAERRRIAAEQAQVEKAYAAREAECRQRFIVTSCLDAARRDRREALEKLHRQEVVLDEAQRKQRAAQRIEEIRAKVSADDGKRREAEARVQARDAKRQEQAAQEEAGASGSAASAPTAASAASATSTASTASTAGKATARVRSVAAKRPVDTDHAASAYDQRQQQAQEHRAAVERRNAERAAKSKPSRPLPARGSASSARQAP
jgi:hypothetical protein